MNARHFQAALNSLPITSKGKEMKASQIALRRANEIKDLFGQIASLQLSALERAFRIGELFMEQKAECGHGEWLPWLEEHFPAKADGKGGISPQSAAQYIRAYQNREELRAAMIETFSDARKYLAEHSTKGNKHQSAQKNKPPSAKQRAKLENEQVEQQKKEQKRSPKRKVWGFFCFNTAYRQGDYLFLRCMRRSRRKSRSCSLAALTSWCASL